MVYNTESGVYQGMLFSYNYNGLKWGYIRGSHATKDEAKKVINILNQGTAASTIHSVVTQGSDWMIPYNGDVSIIQHNRGQICFFAADGKVNENENTYSATKTNISKTRSQDCEGHAFTADSYRLSWNGKTINNAEVNVCFKAGTPVKTDKGYVPIETIKAGDRVWSVDTKTGERDYKKVTSTKKSVTQSLVELGINGEIIYATPEHPFFVKDNAWPWMEASRLEIGQEVQTGIQGNYAKITSKKFVSGACDVYNLTVDGWETYTVGNCEAVVHNICYIVKWIPVGQLVTFELYAGKGGEITLRYLGRGKWKVESVSAGIGWDIAIHKGPINVDLSLKAILTYTFDPRLPISASGEAHAAFLEFVDAGFRFTGAANILTGDYDISVGGLVSLNGVGGYLDFNSFTNPDTGYIENTKNYGWMVDMKGYSWEVDNGYTFNLLHFGKIGP
jgi:hypothetical protein